MRVVHVAQPSDGGVVALVVAMASHQVAAGLNVTVIGHGVAVDTYRATGAHVVEWTIPRSQRRAFDPAAIKTLKRLVFRTTPDIVHLHSSFAALQGRLAIRARLPTVVQPHAWSFRALDGTAARAAQRLEERLGAWTHLYLFDGEDEATWLRTRRRWRPGRVVGTGADLFRFRPASADERLALRRTLELPVDGDVVVCVGRLARQKGQDRLLSSWCAEPPSGTSLVVVGDGPDRDDLVRRAAGRPDVLFAGSTDRPEDWLRAADVMVQPSRWEGASVATKEALACALPVIASPAEGMSAAIDALGRPAGAIVEDERWWEAVHDVLDDRQRRDDWAARARTLAEERHSMSGVTERVLAAYESLLAN